jgi:hypothetical protein
MEYLRIVLQLVKEEGLQLHLKECSFGLRKYLGTLCREAKFQFRPAKSTLLKTGWSL